MSKAYTNRYQLLLQLLIIAREEAGLTQKEVADKLNKPQSFVSKIESGERRIDLIELEDLCTVYDVPITYFDTRKGDHPK